MPTDFLVLLVLEQLKKKGWGVESDAYNRRDSQPLVASTLAWCQPRGACRKDMLQSPFADLSTVQLMHPPRVSFNCRIISRNVGNHIFHQFSRTRRNDGDHSPLNPITPCCAYQFKSFELERCLVVVSDSPGEYERRVRVDSSIRYTTRDVGRPKSALPSPVPLFLLHVLRDGRLSHSLCPFSLPGNPGPTTPPVGSYFTKLPTPSRENY